MSLNKAINATIALIEGRTDIAKEILRDPQSDVRNIPAIMVRLNRVVDLAAARAMRNVLVTALGIQPQLPVEPQKITEANRQAYEKAFYDGVSAVEALFSQVVYGLEQGHREPN